MRERDPEYNIQQGTEGGIKMFERDDPDRYKCQGCMHFKKQYLETDLNIDGVVNKVVVWFPSCRYYLGDDGERDYLTLFVAFDRCKKFKREGACISEGKSQCLLLV